MCWCLFLLAVDVVSCYFLYNFSIYGLVGREESGFCGIFTKRLTIRCLCSDVILHFLVLCHCSVHHKDITANFLQGEMQWFTDKSCILVIRLALWWDTLYIQTQVTVLMFVCVCVCVCIISIIHNWWPTRCKFLVYLFVPNQLYMFWAIFFAHHQEHLTVFTASDIVHLCCCRPVSWTRWT